MSQCTKLLSQLMVGPIIGMMLAPDCVIANGGAPLEAPSTTFTESQPRVIRQELLVTFKRGTTEAQKQTIHAVVGVQVLNTMLNGRIAHVKIDSHTSLAQAQKAYTSFPEVEAVEPNFETGIQQDSIELTPADKEGS